MQKIDVGIVLCDAMEPIPYDKWTMVVLAKTSDGRIGKTEISYEDTGNFVMCGLPLALFAKTFENCTVKGIELCVLQSIMPCFVSPNFVLTDTIISVDVFKGATKLNFKKISQELSREIVGNYLSCLLANRYSDRPAFTEEEIEKILNDTFKDDKQDSVVGTHEGK